MEVGIHISDGVQRLLALGLDGVGHLLDGLERNIQARIGIVGQPIDVLKVIRNVTSLTNPFQNARPAKIGDGIEWSFDHGTSQRISNCQNGTSSAVNKASHS